MQKRWILNSHDPDKAHAISQSHQIPFVLSQILVNRHLIDPEQIERFLKPSLVHLPDPLLLKGMDKAIFRLVQAIRQREMIIIYGDYDVDGTTSTALLMDFFQCVGARVNFYIPHRMREGYSLNTEALHQLKAQGAKVVITVDNGISAIQEALVAKKIGIDLIITDHHEVPPQVPEAFAIINPKQAGDAFPGKELAGVGVAFYLLIALRKSLREAGLLNDREPNLRQALDLVAVGTISDMAPLVGINRILVSEGLKVLSRSPRVGLKALMEAAGIEGEISADQVAFRLGPRINAVGRLDEASVGAQLLLCTEKNRAKELAQKLNTANEARQEIEDSIVEEAMAMIDAQDLVKRYRSLVIFNEHWHPGVVGIVASRLVEKYYLPSIVLSKDKAGLKGSARSIRNLHLVEALRDCADLLLKFGGHQYAAGLSLPHEHLQDFTERFDQVVRARLQESDFLPTLKLDVESDLESITPSLLEQLQHLEPYGLGNPEPILLLRAVKVQESRVVGERHLKLSVGEGRRKFGAIGFRLAEKIPELHSQVDLAFSPQWNEWNGSKNIQLRMIDLQSTSADAMRK